VDEDHWKSLVSAVRGGRCLPFLGAGVNAPFMPLGAELASELAQEVGYPFDDRSNLARVAQFAASRWGAIAVKEEISARLDRRQLEALATGGIPLAVRRLARIAAPIYLTTNYDRLLFHALVDLGFDPIETYPMWSQRLRALSGVPDFPALDTPGRPIIFYLHGTTTNPESLVLTEDDYINFMVTLASESHGEGPSFDSVVPRTLRRRLALHTLLFVGYSLEDWNFRVMMRQLFLQLGIQRAEQSFNVSVQLPPHSRLYDDAARTAIERFIESNLDTLARIGVYWTDSQSFADDLLRRVDAK
jgi:SIR2-like domain